MGISVGSCRKASHVAVGARPAPSGSGAERGGPRIAGAVSDARQSGVIPGANFIPISMNSVHWRHAVPAFAFTATRRATVSVSAALALLNACATTDKPVAAVPQPVLRAAGQAGVVGAGAVTVTGTVTGTVTVTAEQAGAEIELAVGQVLVVRLGAGSTSGHEWALVDPAPGVLSVGAPTFERALRSVSAEEAGGEMIWRLRAVRAGTAQLTFELRRPRDLAPAQQRAIYRVTVR